MLNFKQNVQLCNRENLAIVQEMMRELSRVLLFLHLIGGEGTVYSDWLINVFKVFASLFVNSKTNLLAC